MAQARAGAVAVRLADGRVLVAGGSPGAGAVLSSAEIFSPATGAWQPAGSMTQARTAASAVTLSDGRVLVAGGQLPSNGPDTVGASTDIYSPATGSWQAGPTMNSPHTSAAIVRLNDGAVLVAGGSRTEWNAGPGSSGTVGVTAGDPAEIFDPATSTWHTTGSMLLPSGGSQAVLLPDGRVLTGCGGVPGNFEIYVPGADPTGTVAGLWRMAGPPPSLLANCVMSLLPGGRVLVAGGVHYEDGVLGQVGPNRVGGGSLLPAATASAFVYDPAADSWSAAGKMNSAREQGTATALPDGRVLVSGGTDQNFAAVPAADVFDPSTGTWAAPSSTPRLTLARYCCETTTLLADGTVLVAGGEAGASGPTAAPSTEAEIVTP